MRTLLVRHAENAPHAEAMISAWDAGAADDTGFAGSLLWAIYEADDTVAGARDWVAELARSLSVPGSKVRVAW